MKLLKLLPLALAAALAVCAITPAKAAVIVAWDAKPANTTLSSATSTTLDSNLAGPVNLTLGSGFTPNSVGGNTFGGYATVNTSSGLASANSNGTYFAFTVTPASGYQVQVDSVVVPISYNPSQSYGLFVSQGNPSTTINLASSSDSFGSSLGSASVTALGPDSGYFTINLSTPFITSSAVTFRLAISEDFGWKTVGLQQDRSYYDPAFLHNALEVNGSVTAVPEPSTYAMLLLPAALGVILMMRSRRRV
jgi:hypothetical protein